MGDKHNIALIVEPITAITCNQVSNLEAKNISAVFINYKQKASSIKKSVVIICLGSHHPEPQKKSIGSISIEHFPSPDRS